MFHGSSFPKPLDEEVFDNWLASGRASKIGYKYLLIIWDNYDDDYNPVYTEERDSIKNYQRYENSTGRESLIAAYDLYSESKVS